MEWTQSDTLALAAHSCTLCHGVGLRATSKGQNVPCTCALRAIFRACYARFCECVVKEKHMSRATLEFTGGRERRSTWGRKDEEYIADFILVTRRHLTPEEYRLFNYHFLLGADWKLCCRKLKMDRGNFFHAVYRIQQKLGKVYRELQPYALFPLDEYFSQSTQLAEDCLKRSSKITPISSAPPTRSSRFPLQKTA